MSAPHYSVGIDLGTTNCAVSCVDLHQDDARTATVEVVPIPQLTMPGTVEERPLLPSFLYLPHRDELSEADLALPWSERCRYAVGEIARSRGASTPIRLVSSAKSWLGHTGVDRRAPILPPGASPDVEQVSPLLASVRYLEHLRDAWNHGHPTEMLEQQNIVLTVPASFDPAARELTAEAAGIAGFENLVLLEEPQAAFYNWIQTSGEDWRKQVTVGDVILVIDVGGGTTDLSVIAVSDREGSLELRRIAVGDHILLGGDNMDLALAHAVKTKLAQAGAQLDAWQLQALTHGCRTAKEALLADAKTKSFPVVVPGRGSKLIGKTMRTELTRAEVAQTLVEGFFPHVAAAARPESRARSALTRLGLPYAQDPGITRHLAAFLARQAGAVADPEPPGSLKNDDDFMRPTAVLFNGGVFKAPILAQRIFATLNGWLTAAGAPAARWLQGADLDLAVAKGAAYYGFVRRGRGVRIRGGTARAFYVGIESAMPAVPGIEPPIQALCVAPFGMEEGTEAELPAQEFGLVVGQPVRFRFFGSSVRRQDEVGTLLESWSPEEMEELDGIEATLPADRHPAGEVVPVKLHARVTEVGTLKLEAAPRGGAERWGVEFDVRGSRAG